MCNPNIMDHKEEEYVDYSCSTAVERLSRDVESLLRSWHVHEGCDRHFSVHTNPNGLTLLRAERLTWVATLGRRRQTLRMELELALWDGPASKEAVQKRKRRRRRRQSDQSMQSLPTPKQQQQSHQGSGKSNNRRSSLSNDECVTNTIQNLKKRDDIIIKAVGCSTNEADDDTTSLDSSNHSLGSASSLQSLQELQEEEEAECHKHLPKSLQRPHHPTDLIDLPEDSLFDNFSTMFGIGQHITLTPTNPTIDLGILLQEEEQSSSDTAAFSAKLSTFCHSLLGRHKPKQARWVLTQLLASWLQTALNCAAVNCQSCLPMFAVWGNYPSASLPSSDDNHHNSSNNNNSYWNHQHTQQKASIPIFPRWLEAAQAIQQPMATTAQELAKKQQERTKPKPSLSFRRRRLAKVRTSSSPELGKDQAIHSSNTIVMEPWRQNGQHSPPVVVGSVVPTTETYANFTCAVLPERLVEVDRLSTWGNLLLKHCAATTTSPQDDDDNNTSVVLSGARHVYSWSKSKIPRTESEAWRGMDPKDYWKQLQSTPTSTQQWIALEDEVNDYRYACRAQALHLLEQATGATCWGPQQDPIYALQATVGWTSRVDDNNDRSIAPLASFPLPAEHDASSSLLDPRRASFFKVQTFLDHQALEPTLGTTQRCVLACLIRASTLAPLTLLRHLLWEEDIVEDWDHVAGNRAALKRAKRAKVGEATRTLVDVMDWKTCAEEMISEEEANAIVDEVLEGTSSFGFPSPPEDMFSSSPQQKGRFVNKNHPLMEPLFQSAPVGRLVSDLCARMAQLRTPCSMALVWSTFCCELRQRWDVREPLSRMNFVAGLDPSPAVLEERRKVSTIGVKADLAAFLNCSEPDPDDQHCLIGQKLQVFNIGIETMAMLEENRAQQQACEESEEQHDPSTWETDLDSHARDGSGSPTPARANSLVSLGSDCNALPIDEPLLESTSGGKVISLSKLGRLQIPSDLFRGKRRNDAIIDGLLPSENPLLDEGEEKEELSIVTGGESEFFDAEECGMSVFSSRSIFSRNKAATAVHRIDRKGARCPLHGCSLVASGDQVYAPYLRRPEPLTDDIILERRMMLSEENYTSENGDEKRSPIQGRLEIAYRLQKPKLLSDMQAFKAANPGAIFQDFVSWYGNPGNPLEDYCSQNMAQKQLRSRNGLASAESVAIKLDKATEAIHILNETRNFWSSTWDEAVAIPAAEQRPLFEVFSTVEMTLDYLENMHPAILLNQVMAVTLANSYFLLVASAKDAVKVPIIESALGGVRKKTEEALEKLAEEASNATRVFYNMQSDDTNSNASFASVSVINMCERVCSSFSEAEVMVALATSLLQKFPGQYETVQCILKHADGNRIELQDPVGQSRILDAIARQQAPSTNGCPKPVLREYLLRNLDDSAPCQLSVRYGDASLSNEGGKDAGLLVALTRSCNDN